MIPTMLCTIPFPCKSLYYATNLQKGIEDSGIIVETRADRTQIVQAHPNDFESNQWYVVVHTGNIRGMIEDLEEKGFL